jgi:hypothetical protein
VGQFAIAALGGAGKGFAQGQEIAQQRALQKATLDLQQKKFKLEEEEFGLKAKMFTQQIQQQGGIMGLLEKLGGGQQGEQEDLRMPSQMGGESPTAAPQTTGMAPGGLQLEGVSIGKEGPSLRLGRPEKPSDTDRLAMSIFGRPFTQLDQSQQQQVLQAEQQRRVEVSAAQGAAGVLAKGQAGLDLPLPPEDLNKLLLPGGKKLPFGVTGRQAIEAGAVPVATAELSKQLASQSTDVILGRLDTMVEKLFTEEGISGRVKSAGKNAMALLSQDTDAILYEALKEAALTNLTRTFGQTGVLTDKDIELVRNLFPAYAPRVGQPLPDMRSAAKAKMKQVREVVAEISQRKPVTQPGVGAPTAQPSLSKPKPSSGGKPIPLDEFMRRQGATR